MIFKVLVIGRDLALQTGFLTQVSGRNISTQLFNTLGVSLGIARYDEEDDFSVALQLWTIPQNERLAGLSKTFSKGCKGVIAIVKPNEVQQIPDILSNLSLKIDSNVIIGIVGSSSEASKACKDLFSDYTEDFRLIQASDSSEIIRLLVRKLLGREKSNTQFPTFLVIAESMCPAYEHPIQRCSESECTDEEIDAIRNILLDQGLQIRGDICVININEGEASVSLRSGSVSLEPEICKFCAHYCKRNANVCIIAVDSGWSSQGISQKALLIAAKIFALAERNLPRHVEAQIQHASQCAKYRPSPEQIANGLQIDFVASSPEKSKTGKSLLEMAEERVKDGKLPYLVFNMLKRRMHSADKSNND